MSEHDSRVARLAAIAEILGAVAVVVGLLFVGLELRRNTAAVEAATFQDLTDISNDWIMTIAADSSLSHIWNVGVWQPDVLTAEEVERLFLLERAFWVRMQNVYSQYMRGTLSPQDWTLYQSVMCGDSRSPPEGRVQLWPRQRPILSAGLVELVEECWGYQR